MSRFKAHAVGIAAAIALLGAAGSAAAQSSVSIYGVQDAGITRVSNAGGGKLNLFDAGIMQAGRLGFRGSEDLGGGMSAVFLLEQGILLDTGALGQGGLAFGRQSWVGLSDRKLGTLTLGRQYDFMANLGGQYAMGALSPAGSFAWGLHADAANGGALNNHIYAGDRTNNSIKYASNKIGGFSFGAMYGFGEVAGNNAAGRTISATGQYDAGAFSGALSYTDIKDPTGSFSTRMYGGGARYQLGAFTPFGIITQVKNTNTSAKDTTYELGTVYALTPMWDISGAYQFQKRNQGIGNAQAVIAMVDYKISKRTDLYMGAVYDRDKGYRAYPVTGGGIQSATGNQSAVRMGIRHRF